MDAKKIMKIFEDTAYVRMGGSPEELKAAQYIQQQVAEMGLTATIEGFPVQMATMQEAQLLIDGVSVTCHLCGCIIEEGRISVCITGKTLSDGIIGILCFDNVHSRERITVILQILIIMLNYKVGLLRHVINRDITLLRR